MKLFRTPLVLILSGLALVRFAFAADDRAAARALLDLSREPHVVDEVLVQHRAGSSAQARGAVRALAGGASAEVILAESARRDGKGELEVVRLAPGRSVAVR